MLTKNDAISQTNRASAKSLARIGIRNKHGDINAPILICAFFYVVKLPVMVGWAEASSDAPVAVLTGMPTWLNSPPIRLASVRGDYLINNTETNNV